jgi:hypothetical protein
MKQVLMILVSYRIIMDESPSALVGVVTNKGFQHHNDFY